MSAERTVAGLFDSEEQALEALRAIKASPWALERVDSPVPSHRIEAALALKKSPVGWFTLAGGILGFFTGFLFAIFTATRWDLIVSGKPIVALVPFVIVGFEFTILFAVFGNVVGLIHQMRLPDFKGLAHYDPRCSGRHYGLVATCPPEQESDLIGFFRERGAESVTFGQARDPSESGTR